MTIEEMHINIKADLDHINAELVEDFQPEEIDQQINSTINELVDATIDIKDYELIYTLIVLKGYDGASSIIAGQDYKIDLPDNYLDYIDSNVTVKSNHYNIDTDTSIVIPCELISMDKSSALKLDPCSASDSIAWLAEIKYNNIFIYWDEKSIVGKIFLTYIKKPAVVNINSSIDSDLPSKLHQRIVDYTVQRIIKVINNRQQ